MIRIVMLFLLVVILTSCSRYSYTTKHSVELRGTKFSIDNFDIKNSSDSLIYYYEYIKYSPTLDKKIEYQFKPYWVSNYGRFYAHIIEDDNQVGDIPKVLPNEKIFWTNNSVVFNGRNYNYSVNLRKNTVSKTKDRKLYYNYKHNKHKRIKTKGDFVFLGQSDSEIHYDSFYDKQIWDNLSVLTEHSIVTVNPDEFSEEIELSRGLPLFKNNNIAINYNDNKLDIKFENQIPSELKKYKYPFVPERDSYFSSGKTYFCFNRNKIFEITSSNIKLIVNFYRVNTKINVRSFRIFNDKIYFINELNKDIQVNKNGVTTEGYYKNYEFGIYDLNTKKISYPKIRVKRYKD